MAHPPWHLWRAAAAITAAVAAAGPAAALPALPDPFGVRARLEIPRLNGKLGGRVLDYTDNHGADNRIWSPALNQRRDVYVYLPPGYDGVKLFPVMLFLHGLGQDEKIFLDVCPKFDAAIRGGTCPPMVIVVPDGSVSGDPSLTTSGSFYINSRAGRFGDYMIDDVWRNFALKQFAVRQDRDAHVVAGASMGGFGAMNLAFRHKEEFGHVVSTMAPLNLRYGDCYGRYLSDYDADCFMLRPVGRRNEIVGRFYGVLLIRSRRLLDPIVGKSGADVTAFISSVNPYEMLTSFDVRPGEFNFFIGYGKKDEFNIDAEVESFLAEAARRGITIPAVVLPDGHHSVKTATDLIPSINAFLLPLLAPYTPAGYVPVTPNVTVAVRPVGAVPRLMGLGTTTGAGPLTGGVFPGLPPRGMLTGSGLFTTGGPR